MDERQFVGDFDGFGRHFGRRFGSGPAIGRVGGSSDFINRIPRRNFDAFVEVDDSPADRVFANRW